MSPNNPWKIYFADPDRQASSRGLRKRKREREIFLPPHTEFRVCDGISSAGLPSSPSPVSQTPLHPLLKVQLKRGIMIIEHLNGGKKRKKSVSTFHQALAFQGSGGNSEIRKLNSLKTFDDQPPLAVI